MFHIFKGYICIFKNDYWAILNQFRLGIYLLLDKNESEKTNT